MKASIQPIVEGLGRRLGRTIAVLDQQGRLVAQWSRPNDRIGFGYAEMAVLRRWPAAVERWIKEKGTAETAVTIPQNPDLDLPELSCRTLECNGQRVGTLWLIAGDVPISAADESVVTSTIPVVAELLYSQRVIRHDEGSEVGLIFDRLMTSEPGDTELSDRLLSAGLTAKADRFFVLVVMLRKRGDSSLTVAEQTALQLAEKDVGRYLPIGSALSVQRRDRLVLLVAASNRVQLGPEAIAARLVQSANSQLMTGEVPTIVGVGTPVTDLTEAPRAYRQADLAARLAQVIPALGPVAFWQSLGVYRLLVQFPIRELQIDIPNGLRILMTSADNAPLAETLEAYLRNGGDAQRTAAQLGLHKGTLYDRLHRIERLTGLSLRTGDERLMLHLGMRLMQLATAFE